MSDALPCIACGRTLRNAAPDVTNQPDGGLAFETLGHYGSTAFDPMDGTYIEVNVCDQCIARAREAGNVLHGRKSKPVLCEGVVVGWTPAHRPPETWTGEEISSFASDPRVVGEDRLVVEIEEVGDTDLMPEVQWQAGGVEWARRKLERKESP